MPNRAPFVHTSHDRYVQIRGKEPYSVALSLYESEESSCAAVHCLKCLWKRLWWDDASAGAAELQSEFPRGQTGRQAQGHKQGRGVSYQVG